MIRLKYLLSENKTFNDIFHVKNKWIDINDKQKKELSDEFFKLVNIAYRPIGGHIKVKTPNDIIAQDWNVWKAIDFDEDPNTDLVIFGKKTPFGIKWAGVGHDGSKDARRLYIKSKVQHMKESGNFSEVSEKLADIILSSGVTYVADEEDIKKILKKDITFVGKSTKGHSGDGWYLRGIGGGSAHEKILVGKPKGIKSLKKV